MKSKLNYIFLTIIFLNLGCKKFLQIDPPETQVKNDVAFADDGTATSVVLGMYASLLEGNGFASGSENGIYIAAGLASDELINYLGLDVDFVQLQGNEITTNNVRTSVIWSSAYNTIYEANSIIEGLSASTGVSEAVKNQLMGEALFMRAFCHFYLVNSFGSVPLVTSTNYETNRQMGRIATDKIYLQIVDDLTEAEELLSSDYVATSAERVRVNKFASQAFLARMNLYLGNWEAAEDLTTNVIDNNSGKYNLVSIDQVYLSNNAEAIWQLRTLTNGNTGYVQEVTYFSPQTVLNYNVLRKEFMSIHEENDLRFKTWIDTLITTSMDTVFYPFKYRQIEYNAPLSEYSAVLRLAEMYLVRAEARAMQGNLTGINSAASDINMIRDRAGLPDIASVSLEDIMKDIEKERRIEFVAEWGHRWYDLKRWGKADEVLSPLKGSTWQLTDTLYPLPASEMRNNPFLKPQNQGY